MSTIWRDIALAKHSESPLCIQESEIVCHWISIGRHIHHIKKDVYTTLKLRLLSAKRPSTELRRARGNPCPATMAHLGKKNNKLPTINSKPCNPKHKHLWFCTLSIRRIPFNTALHVEHTNTHTDTHTPRAYTHTHTHTHTHAGLRPAISLSVGLALTLTGFREIAGLSTGRRGRQ